jgi:hypothetical protein
MEPEPLTFNLGTSASKDKIAKALYQEDSSIHAASGDF